MNQKKKYLLMSIDFFENTNKEDIDSFLKKSISLDLGLVFYSRNENRLNPYKHYKTNYPDNITFCSRDYVKKTVKKFHKSLFIVIGTKEQDFFMAVGDKLLYLFPEWYKTKEEKASKYGIHISDTNQLLRFIKTILNQTTWFSYIKLPDETEIISLADARSEYYSKSAEEKEIIEAFESVLKKGKRKYYDIYLYHFLSAICNSKTFDNIDIWGIFPSSSTKLNPEMLNFKEQVRVISKKKNADNILIRHMATDKSHYIDEAIRIKVGSARHFETICLNPVYKDKLRGKNVCIFDDYLTHGNSFECARNLLKSAGVKKIIFVTLGTFRKNYQYQNYELDGNLFSKDYTAKLINRCVIAKSKFTINTKAKEETENLYNIFNL